MDAFKNICTGHETLEITDVATGLTADVYKVAPIANIAVKSGTIYFTTSGTDPTMDNSFTGNEGDTITLVGWDELKNFKAVTDTDTTASIYIEYKG